MPNTGLTAQHAVTTYPGAESRVGWTCKMHFLFPHDKVYGVLCRREDREEHLTQTRGERRGFLTVVIVELSFEG